MHPLKKKLYKILLQTVSCWAEASKDRSLSEVVFWAEVFRAAARRSLARTSTDLIQHLRCPFCRAGVLDFLHFSLQALCCLAEGADRCTNFKLYQFRCFHNFQLKTRSHSKLNRTTAIKIFCPRTIIKGKATFF
jgi:hypothetical protein